MMFDVFYGFVSGLFDLPPRRFFALLMPVVLGSLTLAVYLFTDDPS